MGPSARRRDPRDGRTLRPVGDTFWATERDMLAVRLDFLKLFAAGKGTYARSLLHHARLCLCAARAEAVHVLASDLRTHLPTYPRTYHPNFPRAWRGGGGLRGWWVVGGGLTDRPLTFTEPAR